MGQKGSGTQSTTNQASSSSPPPQVMAEYQALVNRATNNANQPYQQYPGELVAPLSGQTAAGLGQVGQYAGAAQPFMNAAAGATMAAATPVQPTAFSPGQVGQYLNPYTQDVINATQGQFNNQNQQAAQFLNSQNISSGAFGGDRAGVSQAILANQQQTAQAPVIAGLYNQNYNQALSEFNTQQGVGLQAQAFNNQQLGQMGKQIADIGAQGQTAGLQGAQAQLQAGMIPQQEQQAIDTALYNQYLQQQSYPFQTTGWLGNIVEGTGSLSGGTSQGTSTTQMAQGSPLSQGIGAGLSGLGMLGSLLAARGGRIPDTENHEPIGRTFDGNTIYRFNYKGDPRTQIGVRARDEQRDHFAFGGAPQQGQQYFPPVGQQAMVMGALGDQGAKAGMGSMGLMASSPTTALASARPGFQSGGFPVAGGAPLIDPLNDINTPYINNQLSPVSGIASDTFDAATGGTKNPQYSVDFSVPTAIGTGPANLATPMTQIPGPAQNYPALDWQQPGNDFQTAGAEASLQGLLGRPGVETSPSESNPAASALSSAAGQGGAGGGVSLPSSLSNNLGAWASGNPVAFGGGSTSLPGAMQGVSVGQRMDPIRAALANQAGGASSFVGPSGSGGGGIPSATPPRAAAGAPPGTPAATPQAPSNAPRTLQQMYGSAPGASAMNPSGNGALFWDNWGGFTGPSGVIANDAALRGNTGNTNTLMNPRGDGGRVYRAAGGMLGQSGMASALAQPPQSAMVNQGVNDQPGFNNMFGGSGGMRPTFADGGASANPAIGVNPYSEVVSWVPTVANTVMGHGPPQPGPIGGGGGGGGGGQPGAPGGAPDLGKAGQGLKKLFNKATGQGTPATPAAPSTTPVTPVTLGQGGTGSDTVASGTAGAQDFGPAFVPDFSNISADAFDAGGVDLGAFGDIGLAHGGFVKRRGHFALGGSDYITQGDDPPPPMPNDPEAGGVIPPPMDTPMPARPVTPTPVHHWGPWHAGGSLTNPIIDVPPSQQPPLPPTNAPLPPPRPKDQGPPPQAVDAAKTASMVGSAAPPSHFRITDPNPDPLTSHTYPAPGEKSGADIPVDPNAPAPSAPGRAAVAPTPAPVAPAAAPISGALARARQGQPPALGQPVAPAPAVGALGAVRPQPGATGLRGGFMDTTAQIESSNINQYSKVDPDPEGPGSRSQGYWQINNPTWRQFGAQAGIDLSQYPNAMRAPRWVQEQVASVIPLARFGSRTQEMLARQYGPLDKSLTLGQLAAQHDGGSGGVQVAQAGASDYDPNAALAHLNNGQPYFTAKDYADANSSKRPLFQAMMYAGMAMMGGESRNPWINIGRGGMAGMDFYQKQTNFERDWMEKQAQIDHLSHEDRRLDVQTGLEAQKMQLEMMMLRNAMDSAKDTANVEKQFEGGAGPQPTAQPAGTVTGAPPPAATSGIGQPGAPVPGGAPTAPGTPPPLALAGSPSGAAGATGPAGGNTRGPAISPAAAPGQPAGAPAMPAAPGTAPAANANFLDSLVKEDDPRYWNALAAVQDRRAVFDPAAATRAAGYRERAAQAANAEKLTLRSGQSINRPGAPEAAAEIARAEAAARQSGTVSATAIEPYVTQPDGTIVKQRVNDPEHIKEVSEKGTFNGLPANMTEPPEYKEQVEQAGATGRVLGETSQAAVAGQANLESAKAQAHERARAQAELVDVQDQPGGPTYKVTRQQLLDDISSGKRNPTSYPAFISDAQKELNTKIEPQMQEQNHARVAVRNQLETMQDIMQKFQPGAFAEQKGAFIAALRSAGLNVPNTATANPAAFQEYSKQTMRQVMDQVKAMGNRPLVSEINGFQKAVSNPNMQPEAAAMVISQAIGAVDRENTFYKDYLDWKKQNPWAYNMNDFAQKWDAANPLSKFVSEDSKNFAYKGQYVPARPEERLDGQVYMSPKDGVTKGRWNKQTRVFDPVQ